MPYRKLESLTLKTKKKKLDWQALKLQMAKSPWWLAHIGWRIRCRIAKLRNDVIRARNAVNAEPFKPVNNHPIFTSATPKPCGYLKLIRKSRISEAERRRYALLESLQHLRHALESNLIPLPGLVMNTPLDVYNTLNVLDRHCTNAATDILCGSVVKEEDKVVLIKYAEFFGFDIYIPLTQTKEKENELDCATLPTDE